MAGDTALKPLQQAMKLANAALLFDSSNRPEEAYTQYLKSINYISQVLLEETASKDGPMVVMPDTSRMLKLAGQCLERANSTVAKIGRVTGKSTAPKVSKAAWTSSHSRILSDEGGKLSFFPPPEIFQKLQEAEAHSTKKELTPLEEASRQNQKLKAAYEARLARLNPKQALQKTSLTLSLQRQMMENLVVAKAREETLQRKMEERRQRLQEEANRRFSSITAVTPEEQEKRLLYAAVLEYEQDHEWPKLWKAKIKKSPNDLSLVTELVFHILSYPDHPISQLLKTLQRQIYNKLYPVVSYQILDSETSTDSFPRSCSSEGILKPTPAGHRLTTSQSLQCMPSLQDKSTSTSQNKRYSLSTEPVLEDSDSQEGLIEEKEERDIESSFEDLEQFMVSTECLTESLGGVFQKSSETARITLHEHLKAVVKDVHSSLDKLLSLTLLAFEISDIFSKDQCLECIEEMFFPLIWPPLLALYRRIYRCREVSLLKSMDLYKNASPSTFGVAPNLFPQATLSLANCYPYKAAVEELRLLTLEQCPQKKLECIVKTLRVICECAEEYSNTEESKTQPGSAAIGADDLLPILSYIVLRSDLPQLVSECTALEEFIHEGYLIGEEGYCLTSLQSALSYVETLHRGSL
ncbi:VPS9 domain-containing protein 1 [Microcaecilia unicolor]|uniref:VPS9 domain-containing protein 1 n=1 Tax=Microcaecilia unicolor TaxID=1415580 RepID=A0A6P7YCB8_9AMPH|nr:VPS9 domain-containing protein 1 [Microcaecilia unicolor]